MEQTFKNITQLSEERNDTKQKLKCIEHDLVTQLEDLPKDVLLAIAHGIVKPAFPVPHHILCEIKSAVLNTFESSYK